MLFGLRSYFDKCVRKPTTHTGELTVFDDVLLTEQVACLLLRHGIASGGRTPSGDEISTAERPTREETPTIDRCKDDIV